MSYELHFHQIEIPEIDAFIDEYADLCKKHGMQIKGECYGSETSAYLTLEPYDGTRLDLDIEDTSRWVPGIERAHKEVDAMRAAAAAAELSRKETELEIRDALEFERLKRKYGAG